MTATTRITLALVVALCAWRGAAAETAAGVPPLPVAVQAGTERAGAAEDTWSRTFKTGPQGTLELWNLAGDVIVVGGPGDAIHVKAVKRLHHGSAADGRATLDRIEIVATESAGRVSIRTSFPEMKRISAEVDFDVQVPAGSSVTVQTISGDVQVQRVVGTTSLESVSGDVTVSGARRLIRAKSVSGDVTLTDAVGDALDVNSVSGDLTLKGLKAKGCTLQTVSGSVIANDAACERAELKSVSGDVEYSGSLAAGGRYDFKSHSGDIRLTLGRGAGFSLSASTFSGDLTSQLQLAGVTQSERPRHGPRTQRLQGTFGDGSAKVDVTTFSGSVVVAGAP
jgi:DUF4097 and DUF4098 domain-containing protein YvlB